MRRPVMRNDFMARSETENIQPSVTLEGSRSLPTLRKSSGHSSVNVTRLGTFAEKLWMCDSPRSVTVTIGHEVA